MRAAGLVVVQRALEHGLVEWQPDGTVRLRLPDDPDTILALRPHHQTIEAVLRRAAAFQRQLTTPDSEPFCRFRDARWHRPGTCPSCHGKVAEHELLRCDLCSLAADLALAAPNQAEQGAEERRG